MICKMKTYDEATQKIFTSLSINKSNFMAHVIRGGNNRMTKRLLFNDDCRKKLDL